MNYALFFLGFIPTIYIATMTSEEGVALVNQRDLYLKYKIKEITINDGLTTIITLDDSCYFKELNQFCRNKILQEQQFFGPKNQNDKTISYDLNCTGKINYEHYNLYENGLIKVSDTKSDDMLYDSKTESFYDSLNRLIKTVSYEYRDKYIQFWDEKTYHGNSGYTEIRYDDDSTVIITSIVTLDTMGREIKSESYYNGYITSRYISEYDKLGNRTHYIGHFLPSKKFILEEKNYYNENGRIDSSFYNYGDTKTSTYFYYSMKGFLIKSEYIKDGNKTFTKYSYK